MTVESLTVRHTQRRLAEKLDATLRVSLYPLLYILVFFYTGVVDVV